MNPIENESITPAEPSAGGAEPRRFLETGPGRILLLSSIGVLGAGLILFTLYYQRFAHIIDARLAAGAFADTVNIYSSPRIVAIGDSFTAEQVVARLRQSGYTTARGNTVGWYNVRPNAVEIFPGRDSFLGGEPAVLTFKNGKLAGIISLQDNTERTEYQLEPQLITNLSENREKRRLVHFAEIPPALVNAVISAEDKRFFTHTGFDIFRILKAAYVDLKDGRKEQGASTLSMQLARGLWLEPDKRWTRKMAELMLTLHLEHKLTKQQIFEDYANQVYLGRRGPFSINGFGEGARVYFGKDLGQLTIPEAAMLAGIVQRPSYDNPFRYPERAKDRRDLVLALMRQNGFVTEEQFRAATAAPLGLAPERMEGLDTQYFLDVMNDELQARLDDHEKHTQYVYTTLDPDLQSAAEAAVRIGMENVDEQLKKKKKKKGEAVPTGQPQVALVALDPHTGEIKALVGGRNYGESQLNHALAMRQPGSVFKPFVYAAALDSGVSGGREIFTTASVIDDSPTTFEFAHQVYSPNNFNHEFMGEVTLRTALAHSLNVATVKLAEQVGYDKIVALARRAGLNSAIQPTPAVALGAYETTPLEMAGAYTVFANHGKRLGPASVSLVRARDGSVLYEHQPDPQTVLDPRVNYLMVSLMQEVLRSGTGAGVRARGFALPAAGKTGTSHDGWFAGFTSELLCVVWVGFDDNRELNLEGARSALPIWAEFMKLASRFRQYRDAKAFQMPAGIVSAEICADSGQLASPSCPNVHSDVFLDGTQPVVECQLHAPGAQQNVADRVVDPTSGVNQTIRPVNTGADLAPGPAQTLRAK